ncbi:MAG: exonuclease SbcCD subunit D [Treponema sp.]|nr:MAG: exonuclease SbcCD subunit D [Treponema sp.]
MKLLQTGDLHLGKNLHETSLVEDQKVLLDQLDSILEKGAYAALIIAGDIYDRTVPPAEAVELFSDFLVSMRRKHPDTELFMVPGNHDSAQRLSYADGILGTQGIHIVCNPEKSFEPIITAKGSERLAVFLLPFLSPGSLGTVPTEPVSATEKQPDRKDGMFEFDFSHEETEPVEPTKPAAHRLLSSQADLAAEAARRFDAVLESPKYRIMPSLLVAHLFTLAGVQSESERIFLGTSEKVSPALFSKFSYTALGHLHKCQKITDRMYYAGSPLAYAFDEAGTEKCFLEIEIDCLDPAFPVSVRKIPVQPLRPLSRLEGTFEEFYQGTAYAPYSSHYLEITLTDSELIANPMNLLKPKFPYLLSLKQGLYETGPASTRDSGSTGAADALFDEKRDPVTDFIRFEEELYGTADSDRVELFRELLSECADEA